ncbi:hypothetical protein LguiA_014785 [Lonicera macranthoides]
MSIVAGSYERFIWGFNLKTLEISQSEPPQTLIPTFTFPSHTSPIKSVSVAGSVAVSGGSDDTIKIYDLSTSSEIGSLLHSSTVTSLAFFAPSSVSFPRNLLAGADDGTVSIYDADPFVHLQTLTVHKRGVNDVAIHPSGKLGLTVGRDCCLGMVNLIRGRRSFYCRLDKEATIVKFDNGGGTFFMVMDEKVSVHESEDAKLVLELDNRKRVLCATPGLNGILFTGGEDRNITAWDTASGKVAYCIEDAHLARVKGIVVLSKNDGTTDDDPNIVASASSDGIIRVWDVRMAKKDNKPTPLAQANTKSRLTCLAGSSFKFKSEC